MMNRILYSTVVAALILTCFLGSASAATYKVTNAEEIQKINKQLKPGDSVILKSGTWSDQQIRFIAKGTESDPIYLMAEQAGKTILTDDSNIRLSGEWLVVSGLYFKDPKLRTEAVISFRTSSRDFAFNSVVRDCAITGDGLEEDLTDYKWVSVYGTNNTVENCTFRDKKNMGTLLVVWVRDDAESNHIIRGNYFSRPHTIMGEDGKPINGQETIRIGTSQVSMEYTNCIIENNYLEHCNGEIEVISNKGCGNIYRGNTFYECIGTLTLRHGNDCEVYGNVFNGGYVDDQTGGIRIIGERHKVYNNLLFSLSGTGNSSAITVFQGEPNPKLSGYFAAKDCYVVNNTIIDCQWGLNVNHGTSRTSVPVENIVVASNVVACYNDSNPTGVFLRDEPTLPINVTWENNIVYNSRFRNITPEEAGATEEDPHMRSYRGYWFPFMRTGLQDYAYKGFDFVTTDIMGEKRDPEASIIGAFEMVRRPDLSKFTTKDNTGVSWKLK